MLHRWMAWFVGIIVIVVGSILVVWGAGDILHIFGQLKATKNNRTVDLFSSFRTGIAPQSPLPHSQSKPVKTRQVQGFADSKVRVKPV